MWRCALTWASRFSRAGGDKAGLVYLTGEVSGMMTLCSMLRWTASCCEEWVGISGAVLFPSIITHYQSCGTVGMGGKQFLEHGTR